MVVDKLVESRYRELTPDLSSLTCHPKCASIKNRLQLDEMAIRTKFLVVSAWSEFIASVSSALRMLEEK